MHLYDPIFGKHKIEANSVLHVTLDPSLDTFVPAEGTESGVPPAYQYEARMDHAKVFIFENESACRRFLNEVELILAGQSQEFTIGLREYMENQLWVTALATWTTTQVLEPLGKCNLTECV